MTQIYQDLIALDKAFVSEKDWVKLGYKRTREDGSVCHCLVGKMMVVAGVPPNSLSIYEPRVINMVRALGFENVAAAIDHNDKYAKFLALKNLIKSSIRKARPKKCAATKKS